jgi:16S rRNA (guanine(966)-N(2))-methyltransferase RsmD
MRVIAGTYRGRRLHSLRGLALRPSSDKLRESLFNILGAKVRSSVFLDLFAGTGAVGIEALSRGARCVVFIEKHPRAVALIRQNLKSLGVPASGPGTLNVESTGALVLAADAIQGLRLVARRGLKADFVFADPPYAEVKACEATLRYLDKTDLLNPEALAIVEHWKRHPLPEQLSRLLLVRTLIQGEAALSFYKLAEVAASGPAK